jgi:RimJ/RimL family protein N-acetyltransferase
MSAATAAAGTVHAQAAPVVYYDGKRIYFRPMEPEDEPTLRRWINDPRIWSTVHHRPPANSLREREWIESQGKSNTDYVFGIVAKDGHRLIGSCGLHAISLIAHHATLGIMIGQTDLHDHGYGTEAMRLLLRLAFHELNLNRVELCVFDHNPRAIHVYEKCGFVLEGRHRQASWRHGQYRDILRYAILRQEWLEMARA